MQATPDDAIVPVQIAFGAKELEKMARSIGGNGDTDVKLWYIRYGNIKGKELEKHIVLDAKSKPENHYCPVKFDCTAVTT